MAETRHRTILEVGLDDRDLRQLGPLMERALNPKVAEAFEKSMERSTSALGKMLEHQAKLGKLIDEQAKRAQGRARDDDKRARDQERRLRSATSSGSMRGTLGAHALMRGNQLAGQMPYQEGFLSQMLSAIPILGPAFAGAVGGAQSFYQSFAQRQIARARSFGSTGIGNSAYGRTLDMAGINMGMGPSETAGFMGGLGQASGMRGGALTSLGPRAMELQTLMGIDSGVSGGIANAVLTGGRAEGGLSSLDDEDRAMTMVSEAVAEGLAAGVREGRIGEVLGQLAASVTALRTSGVPLNLAETLGLMRGLGGLGGGFSGEASGAAARSITQGFSGAGDREGVLSALAIRNRMSSTGEDYETAAREIEANPVEAFRSVMGTLSGFRGTRGYETMLRSQFERMGISLSRDQAHRLAGASGEDFAGMIPGTGGEGTVSELLEGRSEDASGLVGRGSAPSAEAAYEARRAGIGGGMAGTVSMYRALELRMITAIQPMVQSFAQGVLREVGGLFTAFQEGGIGGLFEHAMTRVIEGLTALGDTLLGSPEYGPGLPSDASAGDVATDALDAMSWGINEAAASILDAVGADEAAEASRGMANRSLDRGAARRGMSPSSASDSAVIDTGAGAVRVETTTTVTPVDTAIETAR